MSLELRRPHDTFFKRLMGNIENVRDFLRGFLPENLSSRLDYNSLKIIDTEKLDIKYKKYYLDLSVECKFLDKNSQIYIVFEHKSYPHKLTLIQILNYCSVIWEKCINENKELIPILLLVFYHGKRRFNLPTRFLDYFRDVEDVLKKYLVNFEIELFDTSKYEDEELINLSENLYLRSGLLAMKHIFDDINKLKPVLKRSLSFGKEGFIMVLEYVVMAKDIEEEKLEEILKQGGIEMPSLARKWFEKGEQRGFQKGIELGKEEGFSLGVIQEARDMVMDAYITKFGKMDMDFKNKIEKISDRKILKSLMRKILLAESERELKI